MSLPESPPTRGRAPRLVLRDACLATALGAGVALALTARADAARLPASRAERVVPNDNRAPAGVLGAGTLALRLEARLAEWHPDGEDAPGAAVAAFAEEGGPARIPGPLVRVPAGTAAEVSVRNALGDTLRVYGLHDRPRAGTPDTTPLVLAPGERRLTRFRLDAPGTYYYWATTMRRAINWRTREDAQLSGAIVVDPAAGARDDRVFVLGMWTDTVHRVGTRRRRVLAVVNGRSWPHTERLAYAVGDTVRWRVINASADLHPMHLHGFYFRVTGRGDGRGDTLYTPLGGAPAGDLAVTEAMPTGGTFALTWVPERAGNWLFHCHVPEHFAQRGPLGTARPAGDKPTHADHARDGMNGLVLGIEVRPGRTARVAAGRLPRGAPARARHLRLLVRPNVGSTAATPFYGYAVHERGAEPPADSGHGAGQTLELTRGEPVRITVVNRLTEPTAVHWHGIELESYYDGVPGFSGAGRRTTPLIAPGDSFAVSFTPPRAGTFIYHTHADEERQQLAGLAGALIVREPGAPRDSATDMPLLITSPTDFSKQRLVALVNGRPDPPPLRMRVGTTYRLRLIQMSTHRAGAWLEIARADSSLASWRLVAKDGADLPPPRRISRSARQQLGIGETADYEVTPEAAGDLRLEVLFGIPGTPGRVRAAVMPIRVERAGPPDRR